ncbi:unnamed protein product [Alternaria alternata]
MSLELVELQDGPSLWPDIADAARILWLASISPDINAVRHQLPTYYPNTSYSATELWTGLNASHRAVFVAINESITIAFEGSDRNELVKNTWANAKGPNLWDIPYAVYNDGNRVHSFFRDMWHGMRDATFRALSEAIRNTKEKGSTPRKITITGFSQGGGVSTMAFTDILEHIRHTYGSESPSPQDWAGDNNIGTLVQHLTFAAMAAASDFLVPHVAVLFFTLFFNRAPHPVGGKGHVAATNVIGHFSTADETFALMKIELFETLQA